MKAKDVQPTEPYLIKNYKEYLKKPIAIGFIKRFPVVENTETDSVSFETELRGSPFSVTARLVKTSYGDKPEYVVSSIVTDKFDEVNDVSHLSTHGSHFYATSASIMEQAVVALANKNNLVICEKICSWPFAKAIVAPLTQSHKNNVTT